MTTAPGFLVRRAQHMHVGIWLQHVGAALTSMQFGVLLIHAQQPDLDQTGVAEIMSLDKNTAADVLRRLRSRGLVTRARDPDDGRRKMTRLSDDGVAILSQVLPEVSRVQDQLMSSLNSEERRTTLTLLRSVTRGGEPSPGDMPTSDDQAPLRLYLARGHLIRRSQLLHMPYWAEDVSAELTSLQFIVLLTLRRERDVSQARLGSRACLDKATCAGVVSRLDQRGLAAPRSRRHRRAPSRAQSVSRWAQRAPCACRRSSNRPAASHGALVAVRSSYVYRNDDEVGHQYGCHSARLATMTHSKSNQLEGRS